MVFDYKSRVRAPDGSIAAGYVRQLSCYAAAVERIHGMPVRAALVDLSTHEIVSVSPEMLKDEFDEILRARKILEPPAPPYSGVTID